uniref:Non-specific serine/threonine protein kinase (EC) n=1 Tax=Ganoderma boninense TaxID=34458 RepID=A0A5K1JX82_9APHY|nr:Non-specific serine/threonine protein kinase (EC [Ganoderma boninense]
MHPFSVHDFDMGLLCLLNPTILELNVLLLGVGHREQVNFRTVLSACLPSGHDLEVLSVVVPVPVLNIELLPKLYPRLRRVKIIEDGILPPHIALLATLPNLEYLSIDLSPSTPLNTPVAFPEVRNLGLFNDGAASIGSFIAHVEAPKLRSLFISETHPDTDETYPQKLLDLFRTMASKYPCLTVFRWGNTDITSAGLESKSRAGMTLAELFEPLLSLRSVRSFSVSFIGPLIPYSPSDFQKIAEAWPDLETFDLSRLAGRGADQYADLESLTVFARLCPRLRELRIPRLKFDLSDAACPIAGPRTPHWLQELKVTSLILPTEVFAEVTRQRAILLGVLQQIFPSAKINFPVIRAPLRSR